MALVLLLCTLLTASLPVGSPQALSSFASNCSDIGADRAIAEREALKEIRVLGFIPCSQPKENVSGCPNRPPQLEGSDFEVCCWVDDIPILAMSLDQINSDPTLLPGYRLVLDAVKSECDNASVSTVTLHDSTVKALRGDGPVHHMILGPACTVATEPVAEFSGKYLNINQVSYTASGSQFEDRERFPRLYTLQPLAFSYNEAYVCLIRFYGWTKVAVIYEVNPLFSATASDLSKKLKGADISVEHYGSFDAVSDPAQQLENIKMKDLRIIIALFTPHTPLARKVWCEAWKQNLTGSLHVWFTPVWATLDLTGNITDDCSNEDIRNARAYTFGVLGSDLMVERNSPTKLVSGQNASMFHDQLECYKKAFKGKYPGKDPNMAVDVTLNEGYVYDSIWAIALALNRTMEQGVTLENFTYDNADMADIMQEQLRNSSFQGISGQVLFTTNGSRINPFLEIVQYDDKGQLQIRKIYSTSNASFQNHTNISWPGGSPPKDGPDPTPIPYPLWSVLIVTITTGIGMICAIICLVVTLAYRKHRVFKRSTFRLNAIICIGIFIGFLGVFVDALSSHFFLENITLMEIIINVVDWVYNISFVLAFGGLLMKTWRIYRIFCNPELRKRKYLDDRYLILGVGAFVAFDAVVLIPTTIFVPLKWVNLTHEDPTDRTKISVVYFISGSDFIAIPFVVMSGTYILMLLFAMFMAYQIKQNIRSFYNRYNDSPIVNLSSLLALTVSFSSIIISVTYIPTAETIGFRLLLLLLRDSSWMFPMLGLMYLPMIFELVREKYTGKRIIRQASMFSSQQFSGDHDNEPVRHVRSQSNSSSSMVETHRGMPQTEASTSPSGNPSSSSVDEGSWKMTPRPLTPLREEVEESMLGKSDDKKTSYDVTRASSDGDEEVFGPPLYLSDSRRPSILKLLSSNRSPENKRGPHHVQFTDSQQLT